MDMFTNDVITMPELQESTAAIGQAIEKLTARLKLVQYNLSQTDLLRDSITQTFDCMEKILNESDITNGILKSVIDWIEVDEAGNTDIYLKLIKDLRLDETFTFYDNCT